LNKLYRTTVPRNNHRINAQRESRPNTEAMHKTNSESCMQDATNISEKTESISGRGQHNNSSFLNLDNWSSSGLIVVSFWNWNTK